MRHRAPTSDRRLYRSLFLVLGGALLAACGPETQAKPPTLTRHTVVSDGHPMAVWEKSPAEPIGVVLLLHGRTWSTLPDFDLQVPGEALSLMDALAARGFATYGLDQRGYGETPRDATGWVTPHRAARDVANILEWIRTEGGDGALPYLFGWSYGSMIAQLTAQQVPDRVAGVILFGYPFRPGTRIATQDYPPEPPRSPTTAEAAREDFTIEGSISQAAIEAYVEAALASDPVRSDWRNLSEWGELDPQLVTVPTLLIHGESDPYAQMEAQAALFTELGTTNKEWVVIPGGDHAAFLETPKGYFLDALVEFMTRHGLP